MRILWVSNGPETGTGYGVQTRQAVPRIAGLGHTVDIVAFYGQEGSTGRWVSPQGTEHVVYPKAFHGFGLDAALHRAPDYDVVITFIDAWVLDGQALASAAHWAPWFPVDCDPMPDKVYEQARWADTPITYARHAQAAALERGVQSLYVPHAVDSNVFHPTDRAAARQHLDLPADAFVFGYVMANKGNPPRKAWDRHLEALGYMMRHDDRVHAFFHTLVTPEMSGCPLLEWMPAYGIPFDRVRFADRMRFQTGGYTGEDVNLVYNGIDCLVNVSMGEGFGVPIVEAQMAGTRVITGGWTAMQEITRSGWMVDRRDSDRVRLGVGGWQYAPHTAAIVACMKQALAAEPADPDVVRGHVMEYDADHVAKQYWDPALEEIAGRVAERPTVRVAS